MATAGAAKVTLKITDCACFVWRYPTVASGAALIFVQAESLTVANAVEAFFIAMLATVIARWAWRGRWIELGCGRCCADHKQTGGDDEGFHVTRIPKVSSERNDQTPALSHAPIEPNMNTWAV
jgi:hypothetical protein